tara:strand:- start:2581 stop:2808 length:228 start_codon:yes stop_codon:yes gene_type:complete
LSAFCLALIQSGFAGVHEDETAGLLDGALRLLSALQEPCDDVANSGPADAALPAASASASAPAAAAAAVAWALGV